MNLILQNSYKSQALKRGKVCNLPATDFNIWRSLHLETDGLTFEVKSSLDRTSTTPFLDTFWGHLPSRIYKTKTRFWTKKS